jgi:hypothetical protein
MIGGLLALAFFCFYMFLAVRFLARRAAAHGPTRPQSRVARRRSQTAVAGEPIEVVPSRLWTALDDLQVTRLLRDAAP